MTATAQQLEYLKNSIKSIQDYPKPGILFRDVTSLLEDPKAYALSIDLLVERYKNAGITKVVGTEARGFLFDGFQHRGQGAVEQSAFHHAHPATGQPLPLRAGGNHEHDEGLGVPERPPAVLVSSLGYERQAAQPHSAHQEAEVA